MKNAYIFTTLLLSILGIQSAFSQCNILISDPSPCAASLVNFDVENPSGAYAWDFNNDNLIDAFSTAASFTYPANNIDVPYTVVLYQDGIACNTMDIIVGGTPDPSIGVIPGSGILEDNLIRVCSSNPDISLEIYNASASYAINQSYSINWGDGSVETFDNTSFSNTSTISHDYSTYGYYTITLTVTTAEGCISSNSYTLYNGSNPSVGLANPGNTVGLCVPATIDFPLTNTVDNATGTIYSVYISGEVVATYTQDNVPPVFSYTFLESSCDNTTSTGNYDNAFDVQILATNPCGTSQATIEPIELSEPLELIFDVDQPSIGCEGTVYTFTNDSDGLGEVTAGTCTDLSPSWSITPGIPGIHWEIVGGNTFASQEIEIVFLIPGNYTIEMTINSPSCGLQSYAQSVEIFEGSDISVSGYLEAVISPGNENCIPTIGYFTNESVGDSLVFHWDVDPNDGWEYVDTFNENTTDLQVMFTEAGEYHVQLEAENYCGVANWDTTLIIAAAPEITFDPFPVWCNEATLDFDEDNVNLDLNYGLISSVEWSFPGAVPSSSNELYPTNIHYAIPGSYWIDVTITNECGTASATQNLIIEASGIVTVSDDIIVCEDAPAFFVTGTPAGGTWNGNDVTSEGEFTPSNDNIGQNILTYTVNQGSCILEEDLLITVTPLPAIEMPNEQILCINESAYDLSAVTPAGGTWTGTGISGNNFNPAIAGVGIHTITYSYTDPLTDCYSDETMNMEVIPLPIITVSDSNYCITPGLVALPYATPTGGNWSGPAVVGDNFDPQAAGGAGSYNLSYSYIDSNYCENTAQVIITLVEPVIVDAGSDFEICENADIIDLSQVASPTGGIWNANGSLGLNGSFFDPALAGEGIHLLSYSIGIGNCMVMDEIEIVVLPVTEVLTMDDVELCINTEIITLEASPLGGQWNSNNGANLVGNTFNPLANGNGVYSFTYSYTDPNGCTNTDDLLITVFPVGEAAFTMPNFACRNESVQFTNLSTQGNQSYWQFGTGAGTSTEMNPTYTFTAVGNYTVTLIIENEFGCTDTVSHDIEIADVPVALFEPLVTETCANTGVEFNNQSFGDSLSFYWEFGDFQTSTEENPGMVYFEQANFDTTYVITLTVSNPCGSSVYQSLIVVHPIPNINFGLVPLTDCSPVMVDFANSSTGSASSYFWDFGNGNTSTEQFPETEAFFTDSLFSVYTITLIGSNLCGADTAIVDLLVESANVVAAAEISTNNGCAPLSVEFTNFSSPTATIDWDFGDGNSSSLAEPTHTYTEPGDYLVIQYASSDCGYDTTVFNINVYPSPEVSFVHDENICSGQSIEFTNTAINTSGHYWDFGDGDTSSLNNPVHVYDSAGVYTVTLTGISIFNQCPSTFTSEITVLELPTADFEPSTTFGCAPLEVNFSNNSNNALFYEWDFGDGNTTIDSNPTHTFLEAGTYEVTLRATDVNGCFDDYAIYNVIVQAQPVSDFTYTQTSDCGLPVTFNFQNISEQAIDYEWSFGDGGTSAFTDPEHTYTEAGIYEVSLISFNQFSCSDTFSLSFEIHELPEAGLEISSMSGCEPVEITFSNNSTNSNQYLWHFGDETTSTESAPTHLYERAGSYPVQLIASINGICPDTIQLSDLVEVYPTPVANFEAVEVGGDGTYEMTNLSLNSDNYFWEFSDAATSIEVNPTHRFNTNGVHQIYLEASNEYGCVDDTIVNFTPEFINGLFLPNAFSPEQGIGDVRVFKAKGIGLKEYRLQIYSTYGQLLWETTELDEEGRPTEGWDGIVDGKMMPQDVYVWKCSGIFNDGSGWRGVKEDNGDYKVIGSLVLLR